MAGYNLTSIVAGNDTTFLSFTQGVNTVLMNDMLGALFLGGIGVVLFTSFIFIGVSFPKAILATSFISFNLSLILVAVNLLNPIALYITLIATIISVALSWEP